MQDKDSIRSSINKRMNVVQRCIRTPNIVLHVRALSYYSFCFVVINLKFLFIPRKDEHVCIIPIVLPSLVILTKIWRAALSLKTRKQESGYPVLSN